MIDFLWIKAVLKALFLPPTGLLLLAALGLGLQRRFPRVGRALAAVGVVLLLAISVPFVADHLTDLVDASTAFRRSDGDGAQAIVILGGGIRPSAPEYGGTTLGILTLERVRYGARVARMTGLPVLVSGGSVLGGVPEAWVMRAALESEFGVRVRWVEARSRTTHENAVRSAELLRQQGIQRVVLVTHNFDMLRAKAEFAAQGIDAVPAATGVRIEGSYTLLDFLPSMGGLQQSYYAIYEILANLVRIASGP
ncbi:MAG TPA: YdcF family protein [Casimicrobiaceae bacterium]|nr:YdcF family protein [Casimicrobiaceae bacterium]